MGSISIHDAAEAYLSDIPKPLKRMLPEYSKYEDKLLKLILSKYGLNEEIPEKVKQADLVMLATEKVVLMVEEPYPWHPLPEPRSSNIVKCMSPEIAKKAFLSNCYNLGIY